MQATSIVTTLILLLLVHYTFAGSQGATCCNLNPSDPNTSCCQSSCACFGNGGGAGRRKEFQRIRRPFVHSRGSKRDDEDEQSAPYTMSLPCRFDCQMFGRASTGGPLFDSCSNPIISYYGDYFLNSVTGKLAFRCFDPNIWQDFISTPGKLTQVINACQSSAHSCVKDSSGGTYNTLNATEIPSWTDLVPTTTYKMYQWYAQYKSMLQVLGFMRCPTGYTGNITASATPCPTSSPVEYFPSSSLMKVSSDNSSVSCTAGSMSCGAFSGVSETPFTSSNSFVLSRLSSSYVARKIKARTYSVFPDVVNTRLDCLTPDIDITSACLV